MTAAERIQQIREMQARDKRLRERSVVIGADLRAAAEGATAHGLAGTTSLLIDAAEVIEWLQKTVTQMRKDANEEYRYAQRDARDAFEDGRATGREEGYDR